MDNNNYSMMAVQVKDARLTYGRGSKAFHVLRGINLKVPEGVIYGLLGPSGCGKTTLLSCVLGRRHLTHGDIKVFGTTPGTKESQVPGRWVGFMPQDLSLYPEFTIDEIFTYFGRLHRIDTETLKERTEFLLKFLDMPSKDRPVGNLSGGQQRRVSFAAALIHRPPLLILDEPTVGVDPLLRQSMWEHLIKLTSMEGMTVIITTHYIEEARQANVVGLMRKGRLLAEDSPDALIGLFRVPNLEVCFLNLCLLDKEDSKTSSEEPTEVAVYRCKENKVELPAIKETYPPPNQTMPALHSMTRSNDNSQTKTQLKGQESSITDKIRSPQNTKPFVDGLIKTLVLTSKNMTRLRRNLTVVFFQFALPAIQVILLCLCIGRHPFDLPLAVVNQESEGGLGNLFLQILDNRTINQRFFVDMESAKKSVKQGMTWGALEIGPDFSDSLLRRYTFGIFADNETVTQSSIKVFLDMSNQQIGVTLQATLIISFQEFASKVMTIYGATPILAQLPVVMDTPVYGSSIPSFTEFIVPGLILTIAYIMAVGLTALTFVEERKSGLFERSWVSGVTFTQILVSHIVTQSLVLVFQVLGLLFFTFFVFEIPSHGPFILVILLILLQGAVGMAYGLVISALVNEETTAIMITLGSFYPNLIMSGFIWPVEGMAYVLRYVSYCLPQTMATEAMRAILGRGWILSRSVVWSGFAISLGWFVFYLILAAVIFRLKK